MWNRGIGGGIGRRVAAFTLIGVLTTAEIADEGASAWDWLVIAACVIFGVQAYTRLRG